MKKVPGTAGDGNGSERGSAEEPAPEPDLVLDSDDVENGADQGPPQVEVDPDPDAGLSPASRAEPVGERTFTERSPAEVAEFLERAKQALKAEGFIETPFQYRKKRQVFGLIKDHGHDLQLHVRAFADGIIESEVELSNRYVEHLVSPRRSAHAEIKAVFEKHGIETETINEEFQTRTGSTKTRMPRTRTKTTDLVKGGIGLAGALGAVAVARFVQRRKRR
ncbi:MAG: hypothetical protein KY455_02805 [Euryarchaeota archaeon]|nr:hypothetical protein [Euryarchaeota archaeon]